MTGALEVVGLQTGYGDIKVVRDISLVVRPGEVTALLGRNGAGKTTALRAIAGLNPSPKGSIRLDGVDISSAPAHQRARKGIAYVQEGKRIFRSRSVEENLVLGSYASRHSKAQLREELDKAYERFPFLSSRRNEPAGGLSGGQQQMLAIAQALVSQPSVLLLDEPSGGLAPTIVADVLHTVEQLRDQGLAILLVEQAVQFALSLASEVVVVELGRNFFSGAADDPGLHDAIDQAYFGAESAAMGQVSEESVRSA